MISSKFPPKARPQGESLAAALVAGYNAGRSMNALALDYRLGLDVVWDLLEKNKDKLDLHQAARRLGGG